MKKIIALTVALTFFATTTFAAPVSAAASLPEPAQTVSADLNADLDALFADVNAAALTDEEAQAVEGEGLFGALLAGLAGGVVGFAYGAFAGIAVGLITGDVKAAVAGGAAGGAALGAFVGAVSTPF
jgi:outer membrane murein-binding lipoprotein Lpp